MADRWECGHCGHQPADKGEPSWPVCPRCKGDHPWRPARHVLDDYDTVGRSLGHAKPCGTHNDG